MPKRIIDGDALWISEKLSKVPAKYRPEYSWLLPLAHGNGCFEASVMEIWRTCYSALRDDWTQADVGAMLDAFDQAKMLFRWQVSGKTFGFFVGSQKEGRLPSPSDRLKQAKQWQFGMLPLKELSVFMGISKAECARLFGDLIESKSRVTPKTVESKSPTGNGIGDGTGRGDGDGYGVGKGMGVGKGNAIGIDAGHDAASLPTHRSNTHSSISSSQQDKTTQDDTTQDEPFSSFRGAGVIKGSIPLHFAELFRACMIDNPSSLESSIPSNWKTLWMKDFTELLSHLSPSELIDIIVMSQTEKNRQYYIRPTKLVDNLTLLQEMVKENRKVLLKFRSQRLIALKAQRRNGEADDLA